MCISPSEISVLIGPKWENITVPCRDCWRCKSNRVSDYVGRCLCEAQMSDWTVTLTLTYRPRTDGADVVIVPRHFQNFIKLIRKRGYSVRYLAAGEYGSLRGRSHFHCVIFGKGKKLRVSHKKTETMDLGDDLRSPWPHGHVYADWGIDDRSLRYVCKYMLAKDVKNHWFTVSKKPPLGAEFFSQKADDLIGLQTFPASFNYLPPGGQRNRPYLLKGASRRDYILKLIDNWPKGKPQDLRRLSEWVARVVDRDTLNRMKRDAEKGFYSLEATDQLQILLAEFDRNRPSIITALRVASRIDIERDKIHVAKIKEERQAAEKALCQCSDCQRELAYASSYACQEEPISPTDGDESDPGSWT